MNVRDRLLKPNDNLWRVIETLNLGDPIIALVVDGEGHLLGTITDGDIRRALLEKIPLNQPASSIMNSDPKFVYRNELHKVRDLFCAKNLKYLPVLDSAKVVVDIISRTSEMPHEQQHAIRPNRVFIMAGGMGSRLAPLTKIIPKPLIPVGEKSIIEHVIDRFRVHGFENFVISLNYKGEMIENHLKASVPLDITYVRETKFLGTAGSLELARDWLRETFFVVNCDVFTDVSFAEMFHFHQEQGNDVTLVGVLRRVPVPYGILEQDNGVCERIVEKPQYSFLVNGGIYLMEPTVLQFLTPDVPADMPNLIMAAKSAGHKVGVFPTSGEWVDVGSMDEYAAILRKFKEEPTRLGSSRSWVDE